MRLLGKRELSLLKAYKYKSGAYTPIDNLLSPCYAWAVDQLPMWLAPNLITFVGLILSVAPCIVLAVLCPTFTEEPPSWALAFSGVGVFLYVHLDAMDGKQARRTGTSSPLGQLFDHGCDCLSASMRVLSSCACVQASLGQTLVLLHSINAMVYMANWQEYHTGSFPTNNGLFGVTEGSLTDALVHLATAWFGTAIWNATVFGIEARTLILVAVAGSSLYQCAYAVYHVLFLPHAALPKDEVGDKKLGLGSALRQLVPVTVLALTSSTWVLTAWPPADNPSAPPTLAVFVVAVHWVVLTTKSLVAHMCKQLFNLATLFVFLTPFVLVVANCAVGVVSEWVATVALCSFVVCWYVAYVTLVVRESCDYLGISCFTIPHHGGGGKSK